MCNQTKVERKLHRRSADAFLFQCVTKPRCLSFVSQCPHHMNSECANAPSPGQSSVLTHPHHMNSEWLRP